MIRFSPSFLVIIALIFLVSCNSTETAVNSQPQTVISPPQQQVTVDENTQIVMGQTIYVPVYSHIYHQNRQNIFPLSVTLSIRNTDLNQPLIVTSVRYYDSEGNLVKEYLESPIQLNQLASTDFFVTRNDTTGGSGANFIVEWIAESEISEPFIEAVMIGTDSQQGISFVGQSRVIKTLP